MSVTRLDFDDDVYEVIVTSFNEFGGEETIYYRRVNGKLVRISKREYEVGSILNDSLTMEK